MSEVITSTCSHKVAAERLTKGTDGSVLDVTFVRGKGLQDVIGAPPGRRILPVIGLDDVYVSLWHLAYGQTGDAKEARRQLTLVDRRAQDRIAAWLVPSMIEVVKDLGARAMTRPDDPEIAVEIRAAALFARAIRSDGV